MSRRPATLSQISALLPPARCVGRTEERRSPPEPSSGPDYFVLVDDDVVRASRARQAAMEQAIAWALPACDRVGLIAAAFALLMVGHACVPTLLTLFRG